MNKKNFKDLILLGLSGSLLTSANLTAAEGTKADASKDDAEKNAAYGNMNYHLMTDEDMKLELSPEGLNLYNQLDDEGKKLARTVASQRCAQSNICKGLNACATDKNTCAGKGDCKGKSKCGFSNKDLAVKVVFEKLQKQKRDQLTK
jgi:hypothetical protein